MPLVMLKCKDFHEIQKILNPKFKIMKINNNFFKPLTIPLLSVLFLISCNDEPVNMVESSFNGNGLKVINYGSGENGKSFGMTIATFVDQESYENYKNDLDTQVDAWDDAFVAQWNHLDDDALNDKEEELGFDSEKPLTDFESQNGLQSLRQKYLIAEEAWLNNDNLNPISDPDNNPIYDFDEAEMSLVNILGEVQIGNVIYKKLNDEESEEVDAITSSNQQSIYLIIDDGDYQTLIEFNNGNTSVVNNDNVIIDTSSSSSVDCNTSKSKREILSTATNKRIKATIKVRRGFGPWAGKIKSKMKSYKKRGSRWRKWRTHISAGLNGKVRNDLCHSTLELNERRSVKRRKKSKYSYQDWNALYHPKVENGKFKGIFYQSGVTKELVLSW